MSEHLLCIQLHGPWQDADVLALDQLIHGAYALSSTWPDIELTEAEEENAVNLWVNNDQAVGVWHALVTAMAESASDGLALLRAKWIVVASSHGDWSDYRLLESAYEQPD